MRNLLKCVALPPATSCAQIGDFTSATALARQMVAMYGMSEVIGLTHCIRRNGQLDGMMYNLEPQRDCSEETAREIDQEIKKILNHAYADAKIVLQKHRPALENIAQELLHRETMDSKTFKQLLQQEETNYATSRTAAQGIEIRS